MLNTTTPPEPTELNLKPEYFFIPDNYEYVRVNFKDILYLEADGSYTHIVTNNKTYQLSMNLKHLGEQLNHAKFLRISRKHIVNIDHIVRINGVCLFIEKGNSELKLPFSKIRRQEILGELPVIKIS